MVARCSTSAIAAAIVAILNWYSNDCLVSAANLCAMPVCQFAQCPPPGYSGAASDAQSGSVCTRTPPGTVARPNCSR